MDYVPLITATSTILVAIVGAVATIAAGRKKASADAAASIVSGFQVLTGKLQEERVELTKVIEKQAAENVVLKAEVSILNTTVRRLENKLDDVLRKWRRGDVAPSEDQSEQVGGNRP